MTAVASRQAVRAAVREWLPDLGPVRARLDYGGRIAVAGCGTGDIAIALARALPMVAVHGLEQRGNAVPQARDAARRAGLAERCTFAHGAASQLAGGPYDVITLVDVLDDLGDPPPVRRRAREQLAPDGAVLVVNRSGGAAHGQRLVLARPLPAGAARR